MNMKKIDLKNEYFTEYKFFIGRGYETNLLSHFSTELILPLEGNANITIGNKDYQLNPESIVVANAGEPRFLYPENDKTLILVLRDLENTSLKEKGNLISRFDYNNSHTSTDKINLLTAVGKLYANKDTSLISKDKDQELHISFINKILENYKINYEFSNESTVIYRIMKYLISNYRENISLVDLAKKFNFSSSYLSRFFKKVINMGYQEFIQRVRVAESIEELINSNLSVLRIAEEGGFQSARNMNRVYLSYVKKSPTEIRKSFNNAHSTGNSNNFEDSQAVHNFKKWIERTSISTKNRDVIRQSTQTNHKVDTIVNTFNSDDSKRIWNNTGNISMLGYNLETGSESIIEKTFQDFKLNEVVFNIVFDDMGYALLKVGTDKYVNLLGNVVVKLLDYVKRYNIKPILIFDIISLSKVSFERDDYSKFISEAKWKLIVSIKELISMVGTNEFVEWPFYLSLPEIIDHVDDKEYLQKVKNLIVDCAQLFIDETLVYDFRTGIHIGKLSSHDLDKAEKAINFFNEESIMPESIAMDVYEDELKSFPYINIRNKVEKDSERIGDFIERIKSKEEFKDLNFIISNLSIPYNIPIIPDEYIDSFLNSFSIQIFVKYSKYIKSIASGTLICQTNGENKFIDISCLTDEGFKNPIYHTIQHISGFKGEVIYCNDRCLVQKKERDFYILMAADVDESLRAVYHKYEDNIPIEEVSMELLGLEGKYKVITHKLDLDNGSVSMIKKDFKGGAFRFLEEEFKYVDRVSIPKMTVDVMEANGSLVIKEKLKVFSASFIKVQKV